MATADELQTAADKIDKQVQVENKDWSDRKKKIQSFLAPVHKTDLKNLGDRLVKMRTYCETILSTLGDVEKEFGLIDLATAKESSIDNFLKNKLNPLTARIKISTEFYKRGQDKAISILKGQPDTLPDLLTWLQNDDANTTPLVAAMNAFNALAK